MDRIVLDERGVIPWIDLAYLGFAQGWEADSEVARKIADRFDECIVCITLSKSFGIYRDRAGALFVITRPLEKSKSSVWSLRLYALARRTPQIMAHQWFVQSWAIQNCKTCG